MTPRRSSRARTSQPLPGLLQHSHSHSSGSSGSLPRAERSTRSNNKVSSPQRSSTNRSQSLDDTDSKTDMPQTRQRQRARDGDDIEETRRRTVQEEEEEEDPDEEEITRCICGHQDYPGLPLTSREAVARGTVKTAIKDEPLNNGSDILSDDIGGMFIQCDSCKVWQHGGCVGIMDEAMSPEEYFCEQCRKDLHRIMMAINGQKSSQYLPVMASPSPLSSRASSQDDARKSRDAESRMSANAISAKRRSTMNSRDAAYDEEELVRRVIEESKEDNADAEDPSTRRTKRGRSDSEVKQQFSKRQRTHSPSPSSLSKHSNSVSQPASDDESKSKSGNGRSKKARGTVARNQREKESRETEKEVEKDRTEPPSRRKGRTERTREPESEPPEEPLPVKAVSNPPPAQPTPEPPRSSASNNHNGNNGNGETISVEVATTAVVTVGPDPPNPKPAARKTGRPPARRGRLGRNQYTRDRDLANGGDPNVHLHSPRRGDSRETGADSPGGTGSGGPNGVHMNGGESGRPSKPRYMNPHRTTMNEMRRRVAGILEFITRMQVEMAASGEASSTPPSASGGNNGSMSMSAAAALVEGVEAQLNMLNQDAKDGDGTPQEKEFKDMTSVEMMDVLTRKLLKWQQEFGKHGDK